MLGLLWLIPALPAAGFLALVLLNRRLTRTAAAWIGAGSVGLSALVALLVCGSFIASPPAGDAYHQVLWTWMDVDGFAPNIGFYLDAVSVLWVLVITFVGFLIHLYSTEHMEHDEGFTRFFMYLNLFVASMLVLVLADNLLLLYLGWEGVGLCSYLLISFWQKDPQNVYSGRKAFIVTRVGDTALIAGLFLLFTQLHTLEIQPMLAAAEHSFVPGSAVAVAAALLILGGAVGKSAQVPLQTWLPDAMAGPSPVSALIHAATMVTAGVYLIARTNVLFTLAPDARLIVAIVGTVTLLIAGFSALVQHDLKRALAYSTISQIGYMFLALGVSGWEAGVFHFMTHAFFKALLFLAAGVIIEALADEHDIFKMGGLARELPGVFWTFTIGAAALAALPFVTDGFYSKDLIIATSLGSVDGSLWFYVGSLVGAFVTVLYSFRLVFIVFFGERHTEVTRRPRWRQLVPLYVLGDPLDRRRPRLDAGVGQRLPPAAELPGHGPAGGRADRHRTRTSPTASAARSSPSSSWPSASGSPGCSGSRGARARTRSPSRRPSGRWPRTGSAAGASTGSTSACSCGPSGGWRTRAGTTSWTTSCAASPGSTWPPGAA